MDFYETSACTNLNIKEVRTLKRSLPSIPSYIWSGEARGRGGSWDPR